MQLTSQAPDVLPIFHLLENSRFVQILHLVLFHYGNFFFFLNPNIIRDTVKQSKVI